MDKDTLIQAKNGNQSAIAQVLKHYNGSVHYQCERMVDVMDPFFPDYLQEARLALLKALQEADLSREDGFYTFSASVMRSHLVKFADNIKLVPWHHYTLVNQYYKEKSRLQAEHGREFGLEQVLAKMDKKPFEKQIIREAIKVEKFRINTEDPVALKLFDEEATATMEMETLSDIRCEYLKALLTILQPNQKELIQRFYYDNQSAEEIAEAKGIDKQTVWGSLRKARYRMVKYRWLAWFFYAYQSEHFREVDYLFDGEIWKPVQGYDYEISNYGRVKKVKHWHRHDFIVKPINEQGQNWGYRLYSNIELPNGHKKTERFTILHLLQSHFNEDNFPTYYLRTA